MVCLLLNTNYVLVDILFSSLYTVSLPIIGYFCHLPDCVIQNLLDDIAASHGLSIEARCLEMHVCRGEVCDQIGKVWFGTPNKEFTVTPPLIFLFAIIFSASMDTVYNQSVQAENFFSLLHVNCVFIDSMHRICLSNKCFFTKFSDSIFSCFNWVGCYFWSPSQSQDYFDWSIAMINLPQGLLILSKVKTNCLMLTGSVLKSKPRSRTMFYLTGSFDD